MSKIAAVSKTLVIVKIVALDVAVGLFIGLLIFENPRRWPILVIIVPLIVFLNIYHLKELDNQRSRSLMALSTVYVTGFVFAVLWTAFSFEWWKLLILPVPLILGIYFRRRARMPPRREA